MPSTTDGSALELLQERDLDGGRAMSFAGEGSMRFAVGDFYRAVACDTA